MIRKKIERRYAKALYDVLKSSKEFDSLFEQLKKIKELFDRQEEIFEFLGSPLNNLEDKEKVIARISESLELDDKIINFIRLLIKNYRLKYFGGILALVKEMYYKEHNIEIAEVKTAIPINEEIKKQLKEVLEAKTGKKLIIRYGIDSELIGGVLVKIGSTIYDGSIKRQLELLKNKIAS